MLQETLYSMLATLGFAIIFNIRGKNILYASLGGALAWFSYLLFQKLNFSISAANFMASIIIGIYSEVMARINKAPVTVYVVCSLIPLVPGGGMYYTMFESITGSLDKALRLGVETISSAGALAIGVLLISSISRLLSQANQKRKSY
ncbi:MAG: threonine/serine exporter [Clostridiales bacterium]|nr:threonine/serine exporter [Clostridiales bacterium]